ncbi:MAG TPA: hypothetical protein PLG59_15780, partial [bacterium]|nr:hypothetical protein [bacterium]
FLSRDPFQAVYSVSNTTMISPSIMERSFSENEWKPCHHSRFRWCEQPSSHSTVRYIKHTAEPEIEPWRN